MLWCNYHAVNSMSRKTSLRLTHAHTHTLFNGRFSRTTRVSRYQKGKTIWILLKQETVIGSGISWAICKSATRSRETTMPAPHQLISFFTGWMPFLPPNQQCQSTEGKFFMTKNLSKIASGYHEQLTNNYKCP